jgi:hypothetical protein
MAVLTELRKALFDNKLQENIDKFSNSENLQGFQLVASFLSPVVEGNVYVILIFQKRE